MSHKIKKPMNWTAKKTCGGSFFVVSLSHVRSFGKAQNVQAICRIVVQRHCNAIRIDATDTEFVTVAKPGNKTNQFWTLAATFSVSEKKNWDGLCHVYWFLSNISSFQSRWVVYGFTGELTCFVVLLRLQWRPPRKHWRVILRGSKYNTTKKEALQSDWLYYSESRDLTARHSG